MEELIADYPQLHIYGVKRVRSPLLLRHYTICDRGSVRGHPIRGQSCRNRFHPNDYIENDRRKGRVKGRGRGTKDPS